jgi:threonine dehydrogenase-like Zn-dependent dehydrogenase
MKALLYTGPEALELRDVPEPVAGPGEVIVRVDSVGICGSDMHAYLGHDARRPAPLILGHEAAGVVAGGARNGERVTLNPLVTCMACKACKSGRENLCADRQIISMQPREGAFAEFVAIPERNLVTVPDTVSLERAALSEPLAVSWHAARLALEALVGEPGPALVLGGGAIGVAAALALRAMGLDKVELSEPNPTRQTFIAEHCGLSVCDSPQGHYPLVIDAVGLAVTRAAASAHVAPGGVIAHIGLGEDAGGLDIRRITLQEVSFVGTYTYTSQDFRDTAAALFDGRLGSLDWIEARGLDEGAAAFADIRAGRVAAPKIILKPDA